EADRDARGAVGKEVGEIGGEQWWLLPAAVVVGPEVGGVLIDAIEQPRRNLGHARFGVALGRWVIAVDIAEIALAIYQRVADREILRETRERVVDRLIAMRMEVAHGVADDFRAFAELALWAEPQLLHGVKQPAVHRLEPLPHVGPRAGHDGGERVSEVALLKRLAQIHQLDRALRIRRRNSFSHGPRLAHRAAGLKGSARARDFARAEMVRVSAQGEVASGLAPRRLTLSSCPSGRRCR